MNLLSAENLTKSFGDKLLFENISFGIESGQKTALIARNGTGKTSLIRILSGEDVPDAGIVTLSKETVLAYLPQNQTFPLHCNALEYLFDAPDVITRTIAAYELHVLKSGDTVSVSDEILHRMDELHAWNHHAIIREILGRFGIYDLERPLSAFSGGMLKKLALAKTLIRNANLIILDEPTNHLDITMIEWLEQYLSRQALGLLVVTHDRYFLDSVCDNIIELDNQRLYRYRGNYTYFLEKKAERIQTEKVELQKLNSLLERELEWMRRQPQARATKAKARVEAFEKIASQAEGLKKEGPVRAFGVQMQRLGGKIVELHYVSKSFGNQTVINDFSYTFKRGERIGIVGKNGTGKSTLLNLIAGETIPDKGRVVLGQTVEFGYFRQEGLPLPADKRIIDIVKEIAEVVVMKRGSMTPVQFLNYFGFRSDIHYNYYSQLSGGEKRKFYLITILLKNPNFLLLDEPTNDLDIDTLNRLEEFLESYEGCVLLVSHDRYFIDKIADHIFVFEGDGAIRDYYGNYSEYIQQQSIAKNKQSISNTIKDKPDKHFRQPNRAQRPSYRQLKEYEELSSKIEKLEHKKEKLLANLCSGSGSPEEIKRWSVEAGEIDKELEALTERWFILSESLS